MTDAILQWLAECRKTVITPGKVLEVGAYNVNGTARQYFQADAAEYVGIDMSAGPGVDIVCSAHALPFARQFNTVICCEMLEHDDNPLQSVAEMRRVLLPGGYLIVTSPDNGFAIHRYPRDYWRLLPDIYEDVIFKDMTILSHVCTRNRGGRAGCNCYLGQSQ